MNKISMEKIDDLIKDGKIIIIVKKKVYDITNFKNLHPGGKDCLIKKNGTDCTSDLNFHSKKAKKMLSLFYIGNFQV